MRNKKTLALASFICGVAIALILTALNQGSLKSEELALGTQTQVHFGSYKGFHIHCSHLSKIADCISGIKHRSKPYLAIWLGNSQLHGINQMHEGDKTAVMTLHQLLRKTRVDLMGFSQPNVNPQEEEMVFKHLRNLLSIDLLILSLVFDDFREDDIRSDIEDTIRNHVTIEEEHRHLASDGTESSRRSDTTLQDKSEKSIATNLELWSDWWRKRGDARANVLYELHKLRNTIFGIEATTKRRKIVGTYNRNMAALKRLLIHADSTEQKFLCT